MTLEPMSFWQRVRRLRAKGRTVYRAGKHIKVDGRLLSLAQFERISA